jgi:glycerol-1-phosphate dehydrogenase [NAD(P)+]
MKKDWNSLIRDVVSGDWRDPATGKPCIVPFEAIHIAESLEGGAADLVAPLNIGKNLAVVSDTNTRDAMGRRVAKELGTIATIDEIIFPGDTHCDEPTIAEMQKRTSHCDGIVVVGSGSLTDTVRQATFLDGRKFASFATAASMNGYGAGTASVTLANGYKTSLPSRAPRGVFIDLSVSAAAPHWLSAAGLGDSLCRPIAQVEWWAAHRLNGSNYNQTPFDLFNVENDEAEMIRTAPGIKTHSIESNGYLYRVLIEAAFGNNLVGSSHSGSMGEHQISHWIDMFAGADHPGTTHGQQVGVASVAMAMLHRKLLTMDSWPEVKPTKISEADFVTRYGSDIGRMMFGEATKKALNSKSANAINQRLQEVWQTLRHELAKMMIQPEEIARILRSAGGPASAQELGLPLHVWKAAIKHARDVRNRWSFLDLADDAGLLDPFLDELT